MILIQDIFYRFIVAYLADEISTRFFCDEFTLLFTRYSHYIEKAEEVEFDKKVSEKQKIVYSNISELCFKFSNDENDIGTGWYINSAELKLRIEAEFKKLGQ